jgi:hypothetical protein
MRQGGQGGQGKGDTHYPLPITHYPLPITELLIEAKVCEIYDREHFEKVLLVYCSL